MYTNWNGDQLPIKSVKFVIKFSTMSDIIIDSGFREDVTQEEIHETVRLLSKQSELLAVRC